MYRFVVSLAIICLITVSAAATVLRVPSQYSTIQAGIDAAVYNDTVLIANGTYTGNGNKNLDFGGRWIVVMSENGPDSCVIDCQNEGRGFIFTSGENRFSVLHGITICNGRAYLGGGVFCVQSSPTLFNLIIKDNITDNGYGAGVYCVSSNPAIKRCFFVYNRGIG